MTDTIARNNKLMAGLTCLNKKTGNVYRVVGVATDATNIREGNAVVIYYKGGKCFGGIRKICVLLFYRIFCKGVFVRDLDEFKVKFTRCC